MLSEFVSQKVIGLFPCIGTLRTRSLSHTNNAADVLSMLFGELQIRLEELLASEEALMKRNEHNIAKPKAWLRGRARMACGSKEAI